MMSIVLTPYYEVDTTTLKVKFLECARQRHRLMSESKSSKSDRGTTNTTQSVYHSHGP